MRKLTQSLAWILVMVLGAGCFYFSSTKETVAQKAPAMKLGDPLPANLFVELNRVINPAIVNISTSQRVPVPRGYQPMPNDPFWQFFEQFMGPGGGRQQRPAQALGTGFIIEEDGLIVTNTHVISAADEVKVQLVGDKKLYDAQVIGKDERSDVALIRIKPGKKLPFVVMGSSEAVQVGEWVAAFGNPFGHANSMSIGIISAKGRSIEEINSFPFLQTDASINPGNSGGPLVNTHGEVIGVNTAIDARAQGIGFAIPIDAVKSLLPQLKSQGRITRGFLGVGLADLDLRAARQLGLEDDQGALIVQVTPNSPAERAGIQNYDVIKKFNEREIKHAQDLRYAVLDAPLGKPLDVELIRNGRKMNLKVTLTEQDQGSLAARVRKSLTPKPQPRGEAVPMDLGFRVAKLSKKIASDLGIQFQGEELPVVTEVMPNSPAAMSGLHEGDIILDVNKKRVKDPKEVHKELKQGLNVLRVRRGGMVTLIFIENR